MKLNNTLLKILKLLRRVKEIRASTSIKNETFYINELVKISNNRIDINRKLNVLQKLIVDNKDSMNTVDIVRIKNFIEATESNIIRLNHLGISYKCRSLRDEIEIYKDAIKNSDFQILEEDSGSLKSRWFFIGDTSNWKNPLFEIVLTRSNKKMVDEWNPHFQIDIDSNLNYERINEITKKILGNEFIRWKLDIPNYGTVLVMGKLGEVSGVKIFLGIGTKLKDTKYQREHLLVPI